MSSPASPSSSESSSLQQTRMQRAGRVKCNLSATGKMGRRKGIMDQDEAEPESPMVPLESITQESEEVEEDDNSLNEVKQITLGFIFLMHLSEFWHKHHKLSQ